MRRAQQRQINPKSKGRKNTTLRPISAPKIDWDARYSDEWLKTTVPAAHRATAGYCCDCQRSKSKEIHHTAYLMPDGRRVRDCEIEAIGIRLFPLCKRCHDKRGHSKLNYHRDSVDPLWKNANTAAYEEKLRYGFLMLRARFS